MALWSDLHVCSPPLRGFERAFVFHEDSAPAAIPSDDMAIEVPAVVNHGDTSTHRVRGAQSLQQLFFRLTHCCMLRPPDG